MNQERVLEIKSKIRHALEKADEWGWVHYSQSDYFFQTVCWNKESGDIVIAVGELCDDGEKEFVVTTNYHKDFDEETGELILMMRQVGEYL